MKFIKSPILWVGGKYRNLKHIFPHIQANLTQYTNYAEPMLGGGACFYNVAKHIPCKDIIIGDLNPFLTRIIEFIVEYPTWVNDPKIKKYINKINVYPKLKTEKSQRDFYNTERTALNNNLHEEFSNMIDVVRMLFINRAGFNGLYRINSSGLYNVSIGNLNPLYVHIDWAYLEELHQLLSNDPTFANLIIHYGKSYNEIEYDDISQTVIYMDSPYIPLKSHYGSKVQKTFDQYSKDGFDHILLAKYAQEHKNRFKLMLLNNWDCEEIRDLYQGFHFQSLKNNHTVGPQPRSQNREILISNKKLI